MFFLNSKWQCCNTTLKDPRHTLVICTLFRFLQIRISYQQSFYPASIVLWDGLPSELVLLDGLGKVIHRSPYFRTLFYPALKLHFVCTKLCLYSCLSIAFLYLLQSFFYPFTESATAHNTRKRVLQYMKR